jgi:hypothetical protein
MQRRHAAKPKRKIPDAITETHSAEWNPAMNGDSQTTPERFATAVLSAHGAAPPRCSLQCRFGPRSQRVI